jgi:hypothetical protein
MSGYDDGTEPKVCRMCKQQYEIKFVDVNKDCIATVIKKGKVMQQL